MDENTGDQPLTTVDEQIKYNPDGKVTTKTTKTVIQNDDGTTKYSEQVQVKTQTNQINVAESTITGTKNIEAANDDERYFKSVEYKGEVAILKGENQLIDIIKLDSLNVILRLMGTDLKDFCYDISFGIYSSEEIQEFRKSITTRLSSKNDEYVKDYDYIIEPDEKLLLPSFFGDEIFEIVQTKIDTMIEEQRQKEEEELRRKEERERLKKEEEERRLKDEEEKREKERKIKEEEAIRKKEIEELEKQEEEEKRKKREEEDERRKKEIEEKRKREEEEKKKKEEELRLKREEEEKIRKEEEEERKRELEEKKRKDEEEKKRKEEENKKKKEEDEKRKKEEDEKKQKELEERKKKELEDKKKKEEEIKKRKEDEEKRKKELEEKKKKEKEENLKKKKEDEEKKKKELENQKKEEDAKKKKLLEEKKKKEEESKMLKEKELNKKKESEAKKKEEAKKLKEKELQKKKEEEEKKKEEIKKKKEEDAKKKKELEDAKKKEEELKKKKMLEDKKKKEQEDKKKKEEEAKKKKELEEKKKKELEEKKKLEEEEKKKKKLEAQKKKEEDEKKKKELEEKRREKKEKEEEEKRKKEEELRKKIEEKKREKTSPDNTQLRAQKPKKQLERPQTDYPLKKKSDLEKENENPEEENNEGETEQKPKKKKKVIKKTITKMVKKKVHKDSLEYQNYLKEKERGFKSGGGGGGGGFSSGYGGIASDITTKHYVENVSKPTTIHRNCINCHSDISNSNSGKNLCNKCTEHLRGANNNDRDLKSLKYYQDDTDNKFDTIGTKEFYQLNKDRYLNDLWKEENMKLAKIDENFNENLKIDSENQKIDLENINLQDSQINFELEMPNQIKNLNDDDIKKKEYIQRLYLVNKPICSKCGVIQNQNLNKGLYFCQDCGGLVCGNCSKSHYKDNPEHNCNHVNIEDKKYWKIPEKLKCSNCNQFSPISMIYNCNICEGKPICKNCAQNHNINNPNHSLKLFGKPDEDLENLPTKIIKNKNELLKCSNCGTKDTNNNMIICPTCKVVLCGKCQNNHYTNNPSHSKPAENIQIIDKGKPRLSDDNIYRKKSMDIPKCNDCGKIMGSDIGSINKCNNCQTNLCDNCGDKHKKNNPGHNIVKYSNPKIEKTIQNINFSTNCKVCNSSLPLGDEECIIVNCFDCNGNLCDECCDNHEKKNMDHDLNPIKVLFIENITDLNDYIPKLKCGNCKKNMNDNDNIYYCDECQVDLCDSCGENHSQDNPDHDLLLTKRIVLDDNNKGNLKCRQCGIDLGNNDNTFKKCDKCKIDLCDACSDNHIKKYPNHNILIALLKDNYNQNINDYNNKEFENKLKTPNDKCSNCNKRIIVRNNDIMNYCNNCNGNLCDNCSNSHNEDYPDHKKVKSRVRIINKDLDDYDKLPIYKCIACDKKLNNDLNEPFVNCDKCHGNICDDCNNNHLKEFPNHKLKSIKYIIPDDNESKKYLYEDIPISFECVSCYENIPINSDLNYCNECKGNLCNNCIKLHTKNNKTHKPSILNPIFIEKTKDNVFSPPSIICKSCGTNLDKNINDYIHNCPKCKSILCDNCIINHKKDYPNHNPNYLKYIFCDFPEEEDNNENKNNQESLKSIPTDKCSICNKNLRPGNNTQISHCNKCKGNLCDSCEQNHSNLFPGHNFILKKYIINKNKKDNEKDKEIKNDECYICKRNIPIINNGKIIYCFNCPGNMCNSCGSNHTKKYTNHKIYNFDTRKIEKPNDEIYNKLKNKCGECGNNISTNIVYNCNICDKNLCNKCTSSHIKNKPEHNLVLIKTIEENYNPIECNVCGRVSRNKSGTYENNICDKCLVNLCEPCSKTHLKKYPNHTIKQSSISFDTTYDNKNIQNLLLHPNDKCSKCKQKIALKNNDIIYYCNNCKGNICNNCNNTHLKENPDHVRSRPKVCLLRNRRDIKRLPIYKCIACDKKINSNLNEPFSNCNKCHGNLCDDCNNTHLQEFPGHQPEYIKYIINEDDFDKKYTLDNIPINFDCISCGEKLPLNSEINYCNDCKGHICKNCTKLHNKNNKNHRPRILNIILTENENEKIFNPPKVTCTSCGTNLNDNINDYIHHCPNCKHILCNDCSIKHIKKYPEHNLLFNKYIFYENKDNNYDYINEQSPLKPFEKCKVCNRNIKSGNNNQINHCNKCQGNLCDSCEQKHRTHFPGHDFILKKYIIYPIDIENDYIYDNKDIDNINLIRNDRCLICYNHIPINNNGKVIYCSICPGSLCNSCIREHNKKYPEHKTFDLKTNLIENYNKEESDKYRILINKCGECGNRIKANSIFNCNNCNKNICNKCANYHIENKPEHEIILTKYIFDEEENMLCNLCGKNLPVKNGNYEINNCDNCKLKLCEQCNKKHLIKNPNHIIKKTYLKIKKDIPDYNLLKNKGNKCKVCNRKLNLKNNEPINYCKKCRGNLCNNCNDNHYKNYPSHKKVTPNALLLSKDLENYNKLPIYKCIACDKKLKGDLNEPFINCDKCHGNICDECNNNHLKEFPTHKLKLIKYIIPDDNENDKDEKNVIPIEQDSDNISEQKGIKRPKIKFKSKKMDLKEEDIDLNKFDKDNEDNLKQNKLPENKNMHIPHDINCISCNSKINNFKNCIPCYGYLCSSCNNSNKNENKFEIIQPEKNSSFNTSNVNCIICKEYLLKDINKPINYCTICNGNVCSNCCTNHLSKNPSHNLLLSKFILTQYISNNGFEPSDKNKCYECNKNLDKNSKLIHYCNQCKSYICFDCVESHNNEYPEHILILSKNLGNYYNGRKKTKCICYLCKLEHSKDQNKKYYFCKECNENICESCIKKHDEQYYSHIVKNPHIYEDDINKNK